MNLKTARLIAIAMLLIALLPMPYGYYTLVRISICALSGFLAYKTWQENVQLWTWIFGFIAVLFNPIIPIYLNRELGAIIDIVIAIVFFVSISQLKLDDGQ